MNIRPFFRLCLLFALLLLVVACTKSQKEHADIPADSVTLARGKQMFEQHCSACHNFRQDGIGPQLGGITREVSHEWLKMFIKDPQGVIQSGDDRGEELLARYKTVMPSFAHFSEDDLNTILVYIQTQEASAPAASSEGTPSLSDPLPQRIDSSGLVVEVEFVAEIPASATEGFKTRITKLDFMPGSQRLFIVDIRGKLYELQNNNPVVYMDMAKVKPLFIDKPGLATGFGSFAFHPAFRENGLLYTTHTEGPGSAPADFHYADSIPVTLQWVVSEWKTDSPNGFPFKGTSRELFRINMVTGMHGVQEITFNPNSKPGDDDYGLLYIGVGDGACVESGFPFLVQNIEKPWGSILRIDPAGRNSANKRYGIPRSNPFVDHENQQAAGEIYAYGFRNPHRITWSKSGLMLASNIGQAHIESVNLILPGNNYGWPIREGTFLVNPYGDITKVFPLPANDAEYNITYPAAQYDHDEGLAISGGFEYTGNRIAGLKEKYLFADMNNGRLYYINLRDVKPGHITTIKEWNITYRGKLTTASELFGSKRVDLRLGKDARGDIYIFSKQDGKVYRLANAQVPPLAL